MNMMAGDAHPNRPPYTLVIPTFNQSAFLGEAIESGMSQTHPPAEIIVVDNNSTDDTETVVAGFPVKYIRQPNLGPSNARNRGLKESTETYVMFLDGDDILKPDCAEARVTQLAGNPEGAILIGAYDVVDRERAALSTERLTDESAVVKPEIMATELFGPTCGMVVHRERALEVGGFDETMRIGEDADLALTLMAKWHCMYDPEPRSEYRQAGASLSRNYGELFDGYTKVLNKHADLIPGRYYEIAYPAFRDRMANLIFGKARKFEGAKAAPKLLRAMATRPKLVAVFFYFVARYFKKGMNLG